MVLTTPTKDEFDKWILTENGIVCNNIVWNEECTKDNQIIWNSSSHFRTLAYLPPMRRILNFKTVSNSLLELLGYLVLSLR